MSVKGLALFYVMASGKSVAKLAKLAKPFIYNGYDVAKVLQRSCKGVAKVLQRCCRWVVYGLTFQISEKWFLIKNENSKIRPMCAVFCMPLFARVSGFAAGRLGR